MLLLVQAAAKGKKLRLMINKELAMCEECGCGYDREHDADPDDRISITPVPGDHTHEHEHGHAHGHTHPHVAYSPISGRRHHRMQFAAVAGIVVLGVLAIALLIMLGQSEARYRALLSKFAKLE
jgi:ABC-type Zn2+ transport system substrate-binding protein/surface adhesin